MLDHIVLRMRKVNGEEGYSESWVRVKAMTYMYMYQNHNHNGLLPNELTCYLVFSQSEMNNTFPTLGKVYKDCMVFP